MGQRMRDAMRWLAQKKAETDGRAVTYTRGTSSVTLTVVVGRVPFVVRDRQGLVTTVARQRDYILPDPAALDFGAGKVNPEAGDRVTDPDPDDGGTFELVAPEGEHCWRWTDGYGTALRLHTLKVG